jgi:nucleoside-diphosphate-sugar epimerase
MKNVLVTGSSGFIGSRLIKYIADRDFHVLGLDKAEPQSTGNHYKFQKCDLLDEDRLTNLIIDFQPNIIIHLAARIDLDEKSDINGYAANIQGVRNFIEAISQCPSVKRCIFTSSQLVCKVGYVPHNDEDYQPNTLYGESKVLTEKIVKELDGGKVEWCIVRPTTVWGPGMSPHYQKFFRMIKEGRYFHVGNRPMFKSYSYIGNIVHQYFMLIHAPSEQIHQRTFYLADYEPLSLREWANAIQRELKVKPIPTYPEALIKIAAKLGDIVNAVGFKKFPFNSFRLNNVLTEYVFDLEKTEQVCGPLPYSIDAGVAETVSWLKTIE